MRWMRPAVFVGVVLWCCDAVKPTNSKKPASEADVDDHVGPRHRQNRHADHGNEGHVKPTNRTKPASEADVGDHVRHRHRHDRHADHGNEGDVNDLGHHNSDHRTKIVRGHQQGHGHRSPKRVLVRHEGEKHAYSVDASGEVRHSSASEDSGVGDSDGASSGDRDGGADAALDDADARASNGAEQKFFPGLDSIIPSTDDSSTDDSSTDDSSSGLPFDISSVAGVLGIDADAIPLDSIVGAVSSAAAGGQAIAAGDGEAAVAEFKTTASHVVDAATSQLDQVEDNSIDEVEDDSTDASSSGFDIGSIFR